MVKRYDPVSADGPGAEMDECADGRYVTACDYDALAAQVEAHQKRYHDCETFYQARLAEAERLLDSAHIPCINEGDGGLADEIEAFLLLGDFYKRAADREDVGQ